MGLDAHSFLPTSLNLWMGMDDRRGSYRPCNVERSQMRGL